ncbi:MAG TPA: DUF2237 domain-containing protein [Polyangiaceae bacterium LLY-WYZ-15_(1-7)]|nr:DUF2237 domain-containing protein [Polyangiaceae bacterium LLY-WYZ-15_(1-7)]HJL05518.1 DUF2237 domain-containing protein [Polyangiaceae bacterium LLY-WYZ-15_(1-7)]HJL10706.1 DUF2237 domain-containing protein [Polyangiaceae bacterium LLY-WYZ-15_(1-7)]
MPRSLLLATLLACGGADAAPPTEPSASARADGAEGDALSMTRAGEAPACADDRIAADSRAAESHPAGVAPACLGLPSDEGGPPGARSVLGAPLAPCSTDPLTGFRRTGACETGPEDRGVHVVCAEVTDAFLAYSAARGNDLATPRPRWGFEGLEAGDRWCLCATRWREALEGGVAPPVDLAATHARALDFVTRPQLEAHAVDGG